MMFASFISSSLFSSRSVHATTVKKKLSFSFYNSFSCGMDPFSHPCSFQNLLNSQQPNTSFSFASLVWFVVNVELWSGMDSCDVVVSVGLFCDPVTQGQHVTQGDSMRQ
ncbi:hypothetical protein HID58_049485 [Brassica napus]|uniref:Secreted protein n=1 Tax=Brassica napus TaxID=3708 RepID=A0ABQ8B5Y3_BRANA|nr:hypothetical protein HID58_049485 [Brassica napus]